MTIVEIGDDLTEAVVGRSTASTPRGLYLALVCAAEKRYGREGVAWVKRKDTTVPGFYVRAKDGRCLITRPV